MRFVTLDTNVINAKQLAWAEQTLATATEPCKIVYFHHPRYSDGGRHGSNVELCVILLDEMEYEAPKGWRAMVGEPFCWAASGVMPPTVRHALPALPRPLEYRFAGSDLVVVNVRTAMVWASSVPRCGHARSARRPIPTREFTNRSTPCAPSR